MRVLFLASLDRLLQVFLVVSQGQAASHCATIVSPACFPGHVALKSIPNKKLTRAVHFRAPGPFMGGACEDKGHPRRGPAALTPTVGGSLLWHSAGLLYGGGGGVTPP